MAKENKIITCKHCGKEIAESAKTCPNCGGKNKKPIYKKWWFWAIVAIIIISAFSGGSDKDTATETEPKQEIATTNDKSEATNTNDTSNKEKESTNEEEKVPTEYKNALKKAESYSDMMYMSKMAIYEQLTSEYGEQFSEDAAQYAMDNIKADWNANALEKAKSYQEQMSMSKAAIYDQLVSEYGERFTAEEAQYAVDHLDD